VNLETTDLLTSPSGAEALQLAAQQSDPASLSAATALRGVFPADLAAAALAQTALRRKARAKFGTQAEWMLFTRFGLEQATRPEVADHHAARLVAAGVRRVADLGCGIGSDAMAFLAAGLDVVAVELDPATAAVARHNLQRVPGASGRAEVVIGNAEELAPQLLIERTAAFCDPARRTAHRRLWRVEDFTPPWAFVRTLLDGGRTAGVKLGPALPHQLIPPGVHAEWVESSGDTVEVGLWAGAGDDPDSRAALLLPDHRMVISGRDPQPAVSPVRRYLYEPAGAVIRAGAIPAVAAMLDAFVVDPQIAYLTSDVLARTPYAEPFEVLEQLPYQEKALRQWVARNEVGVLEIKLRGLAVDPAELRRRLRPKGSQSAILVITRTPTGAVVLVVRRLE
jgi:SAM-dependent methyltransferase